MTNIFGTSSFMIHYWFRSRFMPLYYTLPYLHWAVEIQAEKKNLIFIKIEIMENGTISLREINRKERITQWMSEWATQPMPLPAPIYGRRWLSVWSESLPLCQSCPWNYLITTWSTVANWSSMTGPCLTAMTIWWEVIYLPVIFLWVLPPVKMMT